MLQLEPVFTSYSVNVYGDWIIFLHLHQAEPAVTPALVPATASVLVVRHSRSGCINAEKKAIISTESHLRNQKVYRCTKLSILSLCLSKIVSNISILLGLSFLGTVSSLLGTNCSVVYNLKVFHIIFWPTSLCTSLLKIFDGTNGFPKVTSTGTIIEENPQSDYVLKHLCFGGSCWFGEPGNPGSPVG